MVSRRKRQAVDFEAFEPGSGLRPAIVDAAITDGAIAVLLENIDLLVDVAKHRPASSRVSGLLARAARCHATVSLWWLHPPTKTAVASIRTEVLAIANALDGLRGRRPSRVEASPLYDTAVFVLTGSGGPMASEALRIEVSRHHPIDTLGWRAFVEREPTLALLADGRVALLPRDVPGGEEAVYAVQDDVLRLMSSRSTLTLLDVTVLLRYEGCPSATWDASLLRSALRLDPRLRLEGQTLSRQPPS